MLAPVNSHSRPQLFGGVSVNDFSFDYGKRLKNKIFLLGRKTSRNRVSLLIGPRVQLALVPSISRRQPSPIGVGVSDVFARETQDKRSLARGPGLLCLDRVVLLERPGHVADVEVFPSFGK